MATSEDVERRFRELTDFYRLLYRTVVVVGKKTLDPSTLYLTQEYLESDKLGLVLRETLLRGYEAPIIAVRGFDGIYVLDGHHRVLVNAWLGRSVMGLTLFIPEYKPRIKLSLLDIKVINPAETREDILNWKHMVNIIHFIEKRHGKLARAWLQRVGIATLVPTQPVSGTEEPRRMGRDKEDTPILCYLYEGLCYVLDGHHRVCNSLQAHKSTIDALVFTLGVEIGTVKTSRELGLRKFDTDYCEPLEKTSLSRPPEMVEIERKQF